MDYTKEFTDELFKCLSSNKLETTILYLLNATLLKLESLTNRKDEPIYKAYYKDKIKLVKIVRLLKINLNNYNKLPWR